MIEKIFVRSSDVASDNINDVKTFDESSGHLQNILGSCLEMKLCFPISFVMLYPRKNLMDANFKYMYMQINVGLYM